MKFDEHALIESIESLLMERRDLVRECMQTLREASRFRDFGVETTRIALQHAPGLVTMKAVRDALIGPLKPWQFDVKPGQVVMVASDFDEGATMVDYQRIAEDDVAAYDYDEVPAEQRPLYVVAERLRSGNASTTYRGHLLALLDDAHVAALKTAGWPAELDEALAVLLKTPREYVTFDIHATA